MIRVSYYLSFMETTATKTITQTIIFKNTSALQVYELLMNEKHHKAFTGEEASIVRSVGGKFKAYGDHITGVILELESPKRIVQKWRAADWEDKSHYSTCTFNIQQGSNDVVLDFTQEGVPEKHYKAIKQGWTDNYWDKMKEYLEFLNKN
jgi:activator of HSP90 ATPase